MEPLHDSDSSTVLSLTRSRTASLERANTSTKRVEKCGVEEGRHYEGRGTLDDPFVVRWAEGDPRNPLNWSPTRRWLIVLSVALSTMCVAFGSSVYAGGINPMVQYFQVGPLTVVSGLSLYVLGFALGPLMWAPLSELYGRRIIYILTYGPFVLFHLGCGAAQNITTLLVCRFLAGLFGSSPLTNAGAVISDTFDTDQRALALSMFALAPFAGPVLGPICGGFIGENLDWRWLFWLEAIFAAVTYVAGCIVPESYSPVLLRRLAAVLSKETGLVFVSEYDTGADAQESIASKLKVTMARPFILLFKEMIVLLFAIYAAVIYGILYGMFGVFPIVFQEVRGWKSGPGGLPFFGFGFGMFLGIILNVFVNKRYIRDRIAAGGFLPPEARLPPCAFGGLVLPIGLFWFAWTVQPEVHYMVPIVGSIPFGLGLVMIFLGTTNYLVDAYLMYAASALAANAVLRSLFGSAFPLFTVQMFRTLGNNYALTLLACLSLLLAPIPFFFMKYGARIRATSTFAPGHPALPSSTQAEKEIKEEVAQSDLRMTEQLATEQVLNKV